MSAKQAPLKATGPGIRGVWLADLAAAIAGLFWWRTSHGLQVITCDSGPCSGPAWHADGHARQWTLVHGLTVLGAVFLVIAVHLLLTKRKLPGLISGAAFIMTFIAWYSMYAA